MFSSIVFFCFAHKILKKTQKKKNKKGKDENKDKSVGSSTNGSDFCTAIIRLCCSLVVLLAVLTVPEESAAHLNWRKLGDVNSSWLNGDLKTLLIDEKFLNPFEANYKLTGRRATLDELFYTTSLDTSKVGVRKFCYGSPFGD